MPKKLFKKIFVYQPIQGNEYGVYYMLVYYIIIYRIKCI